jgi:hypothetical protein
MAIVIEGLNKKQKALAEIMWNMDGKQEVLGFISSLQGNNKQEAQTVLELMLWAIWDECEDTQEANQVIQQFRLTGA